jgi:membrane protease YdiL (CAAX protease family)
MQTTTITRPRASPDPNPKTDRRHSIILDAPLILIVIVFAAMAIMSFKYMNAAQGTLEYLFAQRSLAVTQAAAISLGGFALVIHGRPTLRIQNEWEERDVVALAAGVIGLLAITLAFQGQALSYLRFNAYLVMLNAIAEEVFFTVLLGTLLVVWVRSPLARAAGLVASGVLFVFLHSQVYDLTDPTYFLWLFVSRVVLTATYLYSRRISVPVLVHLLNNAAPFLLVAGGVF